MTRNKERGPEYSGPKEAVEEEVTEGEKILQDVLGEIKSQEKMIKIEDEAYKEKEEREKQERVVLEEEGRYERTLEYAQREGASTYVAIKVMEDLNEIRNRGERITYERAKKSFTGDIKYLTENFGFKDERDFHNFEKKTDGILFGRQGEYLNFGPYTTLIEGRLDREEYMKTMRQLKELLDKKWPVAVERAEPDEILAIREKTDRAAAQKHLEGFGMAALDHGDIGTAVDAFIEGDLVGNPEIAKKVAEKMEELIESEEPEIRAKALAAKESLEKFFEGDTKEKKEKE